MPTPSISRRRLRGSSPALLLCMIELLVSAPVLVAGEAIVQPNILFILTDDQGWATLGCYGNKLVPTPHLDSLAREGVRFTDAYVMPQCTPTRAALLTGQHTARNGMWHVIPWYGTPWAPVREPAFVENLSRETFTVAKGLRAAGYATGMAGKWHLTTNADGDYVKLKVQAAGHYGFDFAAPPGPGSQNTGDKHVNYLTDQAIGFIEKHRARPWFFYLAHHTIHGVVSAPAELVTRHRQKGAPETGLHNATYLAAIEHLDNSIGRLLAKLDQLELRERTAVMFLSDNGGVFEINDIAPFKEGPGTATQLAVKERQFSNAPLRAGKGSPYEGGIRVPCLVRWPGVAKPGFVCETPVHVVDWLPTLFEIAGASAPGRHPADGVSLVPLLRGKSLAARALFWYLPLYDLRWGATPCAVVREGDWKLIEYFGDWVDGEGNYRKDPRLELFNLRTDLGEKRNLAGQEAELGAKLRSQIRAWLKSIPAEVPGPNPTHDPSRPLKETNIKPARATDANLPKSRAP